MGQMGLGGFEEVFLVSELSAKTTLLWFAEYRSEARKHMWKPVKIA